MNDDLAPKRFAVVAAGVILLFVGWQTIDIGKPWIGVHDWNGAAWSTAARHLIQRPISETHLGVSLDHGSAPLDPKKFYVHHPPLCVWLTAAAYKVFGVSEAVGRAVPLAFSVFGAVCLTGLAAQLAGRRVGLFSLIAFLATPCLLYYGRMPNHEPIGLPMMIAASWAAFSWSRRPTPLRFILCLAAVVLACISCWIAFVFALALGLSALRWMPNGKRLFLGVGIASTLTLLFLAWHIKTVRADGFQDLFAAFGLRAGAAEFGFFDWIRRILDWMLRLLTPVGAAAVLLHAFGSVGLSAETKRTLFPLAAAGWANVLLFRQGAFVHEYYVYFLSAPAALVVGIAAARAAAPRFVARIALAACVLAGVNTAFSLREGQSNLYASAVPESPRFVVELGRKITEQFPPDAVILVDTAAIGEHLAFYSGRRLIHLDGAPEADLPKLLASADGILANTRLPATRELLDRLLAMARGRVVGREDFTVEGHAFAAVKLGRE